MNVRVASKKAGIKGTGNRIRAKRLNRLRIVGSRNVARVFTGTTTVRVIGDNNVVRADVRD